MDAIIYAAKSTEDKRGSIPTQLADCRAMAEREGLTVVAEYQDEAKSAYSGSRGPGLEQAKVHAERVAPCALIVQHTDRLARGDGVAAAHLVEVLLWAMKCGVRIRSVQDDRTGESILDAALTGTRNFEDSERKSKATKAGKQRKIDRGEWPGGPIPDGYLLARDPATDRRTLQEDPERSPIIRQIFQLRDEGMSFGAIARRMNAEGYRTRPSAARKHEGLPFTSTRVKDTLSNPVYAGRAVMGRRTSEQPTVVQGAWPPLVEPSLFDRATVKAGLRKTIESKGGRPPTAFVLGSLAVCNACGRPMTGRRSEYTRKDGTRQRFYRCAGAREGTCNVPRLDADLIEEGVKDYIAGIFIDFDAWAAEQAKAGEKQRTAAEAELARQRKDLVRLQRQRDKVRKAYTEKMTPARELALEGVIEEVAAVEARVGTAEATLAATDGAVQTDAMLDAYSALKRTLDDESAPLNERLRRVFEEFRIGLVDDGQTIAILPALLPDAREAYADPSGAVKVIDAATGKSTLVAGDEHTEASPVMLLVPPPVKGVSVPNLPNTWA